MTLLREREFRNFWLAQSISLLGDQVAVLALPLVAAGHDRGRRRARPPGGHDPARVRTGRADAGAGLRGRIPGRLARGSLRPLVPDAVIGGNPIFRPTLVSVATLNFFNYTFSALFVLYATRSLGVGPGALGLVLGAGAVGGILGAVCAGRLGRAIGVGRAFLVGCVLFPAPLVLVPLAEGPHSLVLGMLFTAEFLSGLGVMILDINAGSIMFALTPDRLRSRATGAFNFVNWGIRPLGSLAGGALGAWIGVRPTLWVASIGAVAGAVWLLPSPVRSLRDLPEEAA